MTNIPNPKPISASRVTISQLMHLEHANLLGTVHSGLIMKLADEAGALACMRHAQKKGVTVAIDSMTFRQPIRIGLNALSPANPHWRSDHPQRRSRLHGAHFVGSRSSGDC